MLVIRSSNLVLNMTNILITTNDNNISLVIMYYDNMAHSL